MTARRLVIGYASMRIANALGLLAAPGRTARPWLGAAAAAPGGTVAVRGLGGRDLLLAAGAVAATASGGSPRPWLAACAASDAVDLAATLIADGSALPLRSKLAATLIADGSALPLRSKLGTTVAAGSFGVAGAALAARGSWRGRRGDARGCAHAS